MFSNIILSSKGQFAEKLSVLSKLCSHQKLGAPDQNYKMAFIVNIFRALRGKLAGTTADHAQTKKLRKRSLVVSPGFHALSPVVIDNAPLMDGFSMPTPTPTPPPADSPPRQATPAHASKMAVPELPPPPIYKTFTSPQHQSLIFESSRRDSGQRNGRGLARIATISDFHNLGRHNRESLTRNAVTPMPTDSPLAYDRAVELAKYYRSVLPTFESMWDEEQESSTTPESQEQRAPQRQQRLSVTQDDTAGITIGGPPYASFEQRSDPACKPRSSADFLEDSSSAQHKQRSDPARKPRSSEASSTTAVSGVKTHICCAPLAEKPLRSQPGCSPPVPKPNANIEIDEWPLTAAPTPVRATAELKPPKPSPTQDPLGTPGPTPQATTLAADPLGPESTPPHPLEPHQQQQQQQQQQQAGTHQTPIANDHHHQSLHVCTKLLTTQLTQALLTSQQQQQQQQQQPTPSQEQERPDGPSRDATATGRTPAARLAAVGPNQTRLQVLVMIEAYKGLLGSCKAGGGSGELVPILEHWLGVLWKVYDEEVE